MVCTMRCQDLERLVIEKAQVGLKVTNVLSDRLSFCEDHMEDLALKEVLTPLAGFILQLIESDGAVTHDGYKIPTCYTHRQLATMIGSKGETVTKAFTLLQPAGTLELKHRHIHVKDIGALQHLPATGFSTRLIV